MGLIGTVEKIESETQGDAEVNNVTVDPGPGSNITAEQFASPGDDGKPLPGDYATLVEVSGAGNAVVVAFIDPKNASKVEPGEKRVYSRDSDGNVKAAIYLKGDGSIEVTNEKGSIKLEAGGNIDLNGVVIDTDGNITTSGDVDATNVTGSSEVTVGVLALSNHIHQAPNGPTTGPEGV